LGRKRHQSIPVDFVCNATLCDVMIRLLSAVVVVVCAWIAQQVKCSSAAPWLLDIGLLLYPMLVGIGHLIPSRASVLSALGDYTYICLLLHWFLIRHLLYFGAGAAFSQMGSACHDAYGGVWGPRVASLFIGFIAFVLQVATSFRFQLVKLPAFCTKGLSRRFAFLTRAWVPLPVSPEPRAAVVAWLFLLYFLYV